MLKPLAFYYFILFFIELEEHPQLDPQLPSSFFLNVFLIIPKIYQTENPTKKAIKAY